MGGFIIIIDVSLDLYKIFCAVVKTGNMSQAAKDLFISQPAVSMAIRQLEDRLGKPLLIRSAKGIKTTMEGSVLFEYLEQALSLIDTAEKKYMEMVKLQLGELRIGASDSILVHYLTPFIEKYIAAYPNINVKITNRTTYGTTRLLKSGQVDIGFVNLPLREADNLEIFECMEIHDCFIVGSKFDHLVKTGIRFQDINQYPLMLLEHDSNSRQFLDSFAKENGIVFDPNLELGSLDLLLHFTKMNLGVACVIKEFISEALKDGSVSELPLDIQIPPRHVGLIKLKDVTLSHAANSFANFF